MSLTVSAQRLLSKSADRFIKDFPFIRNNRSADFELCLMFIIDQSFSNNFGINCMFFQSCLREDGVTTRLYR